MTWTWRYENRRGEPLRLFGELVSPEFSTQADAETWVGETWAALLDAGVDQVSLVHAGATVYGPMSLHPAD